MGQDASECVKTPQTPSRCRPSGAEADKIRSDAHLTSAVSIRSRHTPSRRRHSPNQSDQYPNQLTDHTVHSVPTLTERSQTPCDHRPIVGRIDPKAEGDLLSTGRVAANRLDQRAPQPPPHSPAQVLPEQPTRGPSAFLDQHPLRQPQHVPRRLLRRSRIEGRLRIVLDHQLDRLRHLLPSDLRRQGERHIDPR